ncbi:unnamed protein product [Lampetra planeri]
MSSCSGDSLHQEVASDGSGRPSSSSGQTVAGDDERDSGLPRPLLGFPTRQSPHVSLRASRIRLLPTTVPSFVVCSADLDLAAPGADLALPPLFGGHILEAEVEFASSPERAAEASESLLPLRRRHLYESKYLALRKRCAEIEGINGKILNRLYHVRRITRRVKKERWFLMKRLDDFKDNYREVQLPVLFEDDSALTPTNRSATLGADDSEATPDPGATGRPQEPAMGGTESPCEVTLRSGAKKQQQLQIKEERDF